MKRCAILFCTLLVGCGAVQISPLAVKTSNGTLFRADGIAQNEVLVKLKDGSSIQGMKIQVKRSIPSLHVMVADVPDGNASEQYIQALKKDPRVAYAETLQQFTLQAPTLKNTRETQGVPDDQMLHLQYYLDSIHAKQAWDITRGEKSVRVGVFDGGVCMDHPDLEGQVVARYDLYPVNDERSLYEHGMLCAGIIAATANNGFGISGVAPGCALLDARIYDDSRRTTQEALAGGIVWATDNGAKVLSIGICLPKRANSQLIRDALQYALDKDVVLVASAGNNEQMIDEKSAVCFPANYPGVIAVAATDKNNHRAYFSNYGSPISVSAPGVGILTTTKMGKYGGIIGWEREDGTGMASSCVAGVAALIRSKYPKLNREQVRERIEKTALDIGATGKDPYYGYGLVDAAAALK
ncbi:MAG TPA: hypothetical protein DD435_02310 [Cyanobacteria bacterium UBA8530]|nr:hypothetical protein [Cyanobacteria bacterium UBA8530]